MAIRKILVPNNLLLPDVAEMLAMGQDITIRTKGNSMLPFIVGQRDMAVLRREKRYTRWDIVLAELADGRFVLHRIVKIDGNHITLMGDGNLTGTESCYLDKIAGRVVQIVCNNKTRDCNQAWIRYLSMVWYYIRPARRYLLAVYRLIHKIT